jgi:hypothetical protein
MTRRHKTGDSFYAMFYTTTGRSQSNFTLAFYKNNVAQSAPSYTIAEIGTTGTYTLAFTLTGVGFWHVNVYDSATQVFREDVEVTANTTDELYTLLSGQVGLKTVTLTVNDGSANVAGMRVNVYNSDDTVFLAAGTTDTSGQVVFVLDEAAYKLRLYKTGIATTTASLTVGSATSQATTVTVAAASVTAPSTAAVCKLYADFLTLAGGAYSGLVVKVQNLYLPTADMTVAQREVSYAANSNGHVEFDVVRGLKIRVSFVSTSFSREITVPDASTSNLLTLMGAATDPFVVVT